MPDIDIAIIINSFNRLALLKDCLGVISDWMPHSVLRNRCAIVIYDAGSVDGSIEWLEKNILKLNFPLEIIGFENGEDTSFAAGLNRGVDYAVRKFSSLRFLLFYETDNQILAADPIIHAIRLLETKHTYAACGFTVRRHDGIAAGVGQSFPSLINFFLGKNIVERFQLEAIPYCWEWIGNKIEFSQVDVVYTSPLLVKIDAWIDSGGLDAVQFPFSDCDVDWARRLRNLGWRMGVLKTHDVIHDNLNSISAWSVMRAIHNHRGRLKYFKRHRPFAVYTIWPVLLIVRHLMELISIKIVIKEPARQMHLFNQFWKLLKSCPKSYE